MHSYARQYCLTTDMRNSLFDEEALLSIRPAGENAYNS